MANGDGEDVEEYADDHRTNGDHAKTITRMVLHRANELHALRAREKANWRHDGKQFDFGVVPGGAEFKRGFRRVSRVRVVI